MIEFLLILLLIYEYQIRPRDYVVLRSYAAAPIGPLQHVCKTSFLLLRQQNHNKHKMIQRPGSFANICRMEPTTFLHHLLRPLLSYIVFPRGYLTRPEYRRNGAVSRMREAQITRGDRLLRWLLVTRGIPFSYLAYVFDQDPSTVYCDFVHIATVIFHRLSPVHMAPLVPGSAEYFAKRGTRSFRHFPRVVYAIDVVKVEQKFTEISVAPKTSI